MLFKKSYSVPANTTAQDPDRQKLKISAGRITGWICFFPEEAADLVQLHVCWHNLQIFPFSGSEWFYGYFAPMIIEDQFDVGNITSELDIYAINNDDSYEHEYNLYVLVEPAEQEKPAAEGEEGLWARLQGYFGGE